MPDPNLPMLEDAIRKLAPFSGGDRLCGRSHLGSAHYRQGRGPDPRNNRCRCDRRDSHLRQTTLRFQNACARLTSQKTPASLAAGITVL